MADGAAAQIVTAALSTLATGLIGIFANMPLALSTGLGVNSYFASIVGQYGVGGSVTYGQACGAVFVEVSAAWSQCCQWDRPKRARAIISH